jgi:hypothetical protein
MIFDNRSERGPTNILEAALLGLALALFLAV